MHTKITKHEILTQIKALCVPAYGCTEIGSIGYSVAAAAKCVKGDIKNVKGIHVNVSPYIFRNVMRVGVPNLGVCGIYIIAATAAAIADPARKLEMFSSVTKQQKELGQYLYDHSLVHVKIPAKCDPVYVQTIIETKQDRIEALIEGVHNNLSYVKVNDKTVYKGKKMKSLEVKNPEKLWINNLSVEEIIEFVDTCKISDIDFLEKLFKMNVNISEYGKKHLIENSYTASYIKSCKKRTIYDQMIIDTAAAIDARMNGANPPVMSSCGSGDHGLTASIPLFTYHKLAKTSKIKFLRSLLLSNLIVYKIKSNIGNLSCMCGSVIAAVTAVISAIAYQMNMNTKQLTSIMESCLHSFNCTMCDGAKLSCTQAICTAMLGGFNLINLAKVGYFVKPLDGIIAGDINITLRIFKKLSKENSRKFNLSLVNGMCKLNSGAYKKSS